MKIQMSVRKTTKSEKKEFVVGLLVLVSIILILKWVF
jgi:hypothetical protein